MGSKVALLFMHPFMLYTSLGLFGESFGQEVSRSPDPNAVRFEQKVGNRLPLQTSVIDESGRVTNLAHIIRNKPVLLSFVYFKCPNLCTLVLNGIVESIQAGSLNSGKDFDLVSISINPDEKSNLALAKKRSYLSRLAQSGDTNPTWHFLTASKDSIQALTQEAGFHFKYDPVTHDYAHPSGFIVLTPSGKISRYFFGIRFSSSEIREAVREASLEKTQRTLAEIILNCFHSSPEKGKYGNAIIQALRGLGLLTVIGTVGLLLFLSMPPRRGRPFRE